MAFLCGCCRACRFDVLTFCMTAVLFRQSDGAGCSDVGLDSKKKAGPQVLHQSSRIKHNSWCDSKKVIPRVRIIVGRASVFLFLFLQVLYK